MNTPNIPFNRIAEALDYLTGNFNTQPTLEEEAKNALMRTDFQQLFTEWAGTSPAQFLQYISVAHAKKMLQENKSWPEALDAGLSNASRRHDLFINIEEMTPAEYKNGGKNLLINYRFAESPFGRLIAASTSKGICYMAFEEDEKKAFSDLHTKFPKASFQPKADAIQENALFIFQPDRGQLPKIKLHLKGTEFQLKVWKSLLKIPMGKLSTYGNIAAQTGSRNASRAVGTAIGSNPVAFLIPCHRVIQSAGTFGGYMWGSTRKAAIIGWEGSYVSYEV